MSGITPEQFARQFLASKVLMFRLSGNILSANPRPNSSGVSLQKNMKLGEHSRKEHPYKAIWISPNLGADDYLSRNLILLIYCSSVSSHFLHLE
jgi:hypothetical protein